MSKKHWKLLLTLALVVVMVLGMGMIVTCKKFASTKMTSATPPELLI